MVEQMAVHMEGRFARFAPSPRWRNIAVYGMLDEIRHAQLNLSFSHDLLKQAPQFDWAVKAFHTNEWGILAVRHFLDDTLLGSSCVDSAVVTNLTLEHGFTNMQFVAFAAAAMDAGDVGFSNILSSIQTDEARHAQQGFPTAAILARFDRKRAQDLLDASFWRSLRLFHLLTGPAMDYYTPLENRRMSFKEFMQEWVVDQFHRSVEDHGLKLPWYWDIFLSELDYEHHSLHMGVWFWRPTVWWDPAAGASAPERRWLAEKYPDWEETWGPMWDTIGNNIREGNELKSLPQTFPVLCNICQLPISSSYNWTAVKDDWTLLTKDLNGRRHYFCSEPCQWIFEQEQDKYDQHLSLVDRFLAGMIDPPDLGGALVYMGITPDVSGKDALDYAWAFDTGEVTPS